MGLVVRTWNVFHGNTQPPGWRAHLEAMVRLVSVDRPAVVCLQEVPVWALTRLDEWSGAEACTAVAVAPRRGCARLGRALTGLHGGRLAGWFNGEGNAVLVDRRLEVLDRWVVEIGDEGDRRICQAVRVGGLGIVANLHATWRGTADEQLRRALLFVESLAREADAIVLCGDTNLRPAAGGWYALLRERGYSPPSVGVDQIVVRGAPAGAPRAWPAERRRVGRRLLSDHAPLELTVGV